MLGSAQKKPQYFIYKIRLAKYSVQRKLAILGASYLQLPLVQKAKELGIETICFAWENGAVCKELCDKFYPISITDKKEILDRCKAEKIEGITSIATDVAVPTMSFIAEEMGLIGNSVHSAALSTNKYLMRVAFFRNKLPVPRFLKTSNPEEINQIEGLKYPLIVKPVDRSGSLGITMINDHEQLLQAIDYALKESFNNQAIIEEFIQGREISVETISWEGKHYVLAHTDKVTSGAPHFVELEHHQPSGLVNETNKKHIEKLVFNALDSLDIKYGASHAELIITDIGEVFITEIGARMGGDFIGSDLVVLSTGYDYLKGIIDISLGNLKRPKITKNHSSGVYFYSSGTKNIKRFILSENENIVKSNLGELLQTELKQSSDRAGYFIYNSNKKIVVS